MGDYCYSRMYIGGNIKQADLYELLLLLKEDDDLCDDPDAASSTCWDDAADEAVDDGTTLDIYAESVRNGEFPILEEFCRQHNLPYMVHSDTCGERHECYTNWKPGMPHPLFETAVDGDPVIGISQVLRQANNLEWEAFKAWLSGQTCPVPPPLKVIDPS